MMVVPEGASRFTAGVLGGWLRPGDPERRVLLLHGGPGMSDYMGTLAPELTGWTVAGFQQRGLPPSPTGPEYSVEMALDDVVAVLDHLGWDTAYLLGHSWGGHLAFHCAVRSAARIDGVLVVDTLGAVGDLGYPAFAAEMDARVSPEEMAWMAAQDWDRPTPDVDRHGLAIFWRSYFPDPAAAPPLPDWLAASTTIGYSTVSTEVATLQPALEAALPTVTVPFGAVHGAGSPMPLRASTEAMALIPGAWTEVVPDAGHFVWLDAPGVVGQALARLTADLPG